MVGSHETNDRGQSILQFALMISAFLVFVSLAVDGGNVYAERRKMQNAADAAALAGAREICLNSSEATVIAAARTYLLQNGVPADQIGESDITIDGNHIDINARETTETILLQLLGMVTMDIQAHANAACGAANSACGLWPIAFDYTIWDGVRCGESLVIWDADQDNQDVTCEIGGVPRDICSCYDCDLDDDGTNDFVVMTKIARGWMDFPSPPAGSPYSDPCKATGCGASELACRVENSYGGRITLPACIPGLRGVKAGVKDEVETRAGEVVQIPLFTSINCGSESNCTGTDAESYYITKFGCVTVTGWQQNFVLNPKPGMPKSYKKITTKTIIVSKACEEDSCVSFCGTTGTDEPAQPWELRAASIQQ